MDTKRVIKSNIHDTFKSPVDIIIPFHGETNQLTKLIESIFKFTKSNPYRLTLVDDASPSDSYIKLIKDVRGVKVLRNETQLGFGASLEKGFEETTFPYVVFMHSDVIVESSSWLQELGKSLIGFKEKRTNIKMVSARSDNPGEGFDTKLKGSKDEPGEGDLAVEGPLPLYCAMCHRDLFGRINGFIKPYPYGWYEGDELAFRMKRFGYTQGVSSKSWVRHLGGLTINKLLKKKKIREAMENNHELCIKDLKQLG